ncbi:peptidase S8/S53 domain-containing protein [Phaeosphaeria sp. MPI-PUGE-AT-0046c]|nr:peptidase S8/S53 domain-containing protein [Phaeosphaeria sp. MPI-PUGE-AT-0046c]
MSWTITSSNNKLAGVIEALEGVQSVNSKHRSRDQSDHTLQARDAGSPHPVARDPESSVSSEPVELVRRDVPWYSCLANNTDIQKTEDFLKSKIQPGSRYLYIKSGKEILGWWKLYLDDDAKKAVEAYEGITGLRPGGSKIEWFRAISSGKQLQPPLRSVDLAARNHLLDRRSGTWTKQQNADKALIMNSQYQGANLDKLNDFVYQKGAGEGIFIYVLDEGVRVSAYNLEFHPPGDDPLNFQILQTDTSQNENQDKYADDSHEHIHGTGVAARILGTKFGLAKEATLISVKMTFDSLDFSAAISMVLDDLEANPGREHRSVISFAGGWGEVDRDANTYEKLKNDDVLQREFGYTLRRIMNLGVPIVCASGNYGEKQGRENIDTLPALFQDEDTPLINVGAADYEGKRAPSSQGGSQLTLYAPGVDIIIPQNTDFQSRKGSGTSLAAPQVAGLIATYLSYAQRPWDDSKKGIERVKAIRDYLVSDASSWERQPGIRMIWNGATKEDHESAGASTAKPPSTAPKEKTKALGIVFGARGVNEYIGKPYEKITVENRWLFFATDRGKSATCYKEQDAVLASKINSKDWNLFENPGWPAGTYSLKIDNMDCDYKNDGKGNPGALWCKTLIKPIQCFEENMRTAKDGATKCEPGGGEQIMRRPVVYCEW